MYIPWDDAGLFRAALRVYFMIALGFIAVAGDKACHLRTKLRLLQGQQVNVTNMTGWLRGTQFFKTSYQMRRLPGGFLGLFMVLTAILALVADLAVSGLVKAVDRPGFCAFTIGLALNETTAEYPNMYGLPYQYASNAQITSYWQNGGLLGIYQKADNQQNFAAQESDLAAYWSCDNGSSNHTYSNDLTADDVAAELIKLDLLTNNTLQAWAVSSGDGPAYQLIILSTTPEAVDDDDGDAPFSVQFAVDLYDDKSLNQKTMVSYACHLVETAHLNIAHVNARMDINTTLASWAAGMQGALWLGFDSVEPIGNLSLNIQYLLNSMTMVAMADNSVGYTPDTMQGCLVQETHVPWPVTFLWSVATFLGFFFIFYALWLYIRVFLASRKYDKAAAFSANTPFMSGRPGINSKDIRKKTPNGLVDWMQHAIHETGAAETADRPHHLRKWLFSTSSPRGSRMSVVSKNFSSTATTPYTGSGEQFTASPQEQPGVFYSSPAASSNSSDGYFSPQQQQQNAWGVQRKPLSSSRSPSGSPGSFYFGPTDGQNIFGISRKPVSKQYSAVSMQEVNGP